MAKKMKRKTRIVLACSAILVACLLIPATAFLCLAHAADPDKFNQIEFGMSREKVEAILGKPHNIGRFDEPGSLDYYYGGFQRHMWCTMDVFFGTNGLVCGKFHDH